MRLSAGLGRAEFLARHRYPILALLSSVIAVRTAWRGPSGADFTFFRLAALVFTGHPEAVEPNLFFHGPTADTGPLDLYRDVPTVQIGPVPLLAVAPAALLLPQRVTVVLVALVCALALPLCLRLLESAADDHSGPDSNRPLLVLAAGAVCLLLWPTAIARYTHPDDVLLLVAACAALRAGVRGRWLTSAVLLGVAAGAKPWGVALVPLALAAARGRSRVVGALAVAVAGGVAVLPWLPFVLGSPGTLDALSQFHIYVGGTAPLSLVWSGEQVPPWLRPLQVGLGGTAALAAVLWKRPMLALPLVVAVRVSTEAQDYSYYFAVLAVAVVGADLAVRGRRFPWTTTAVVLMVYDARWLVPENWQVAYIQAALVVVVIATSVPRLPRRRTPFGLASPG